MHSSRLAALGLALAACAGGSAPPATAPLPDPAVLRGTIERQFATSAAAWNAGDLDGFMRDYAREPATGFVSGGHLRQGYDFIRGNYAPRFAPGAERDSLRFEEFVVRPLRADLALVTARYILHRNGVVTSSGPFTLVMEQRREGWRILHDHTSSDPR